MRHRFFIVLVFLLAAGCAAPIVEPPKKFEEPWAVSALDPELLEDPETGWLSKNFRSPGTAYEKGEYQGKAAVRASAKNGASMRFRIEWFDLKKRPILKWAWAATKKQHGADLKNADKDDVVASVSVSWCRIDPVHLKKPGCVIRYVFSAGPERPGEIFSHPRTDLRNLKNIVLRGAEAPTGVWLSEERDLIEDYRATFGKEPRNDIYGLMLLTDADQTRSSVEAYYGAITFEKRGPTIARQ